MTPSDKTPKIKPNDYPHLLAEVKQRIRSAQYEALKAVNKELVGLYWNIGRMIVERQVDGHGASIANQLSRDLRGEFPGISGPPTPAPRATREPHISKCAKHHTLSKSIICACKCHGDINRSFGK